jgi:hypothetical protein
MNKFFLLSLLALSSASASPSAVPNFKESTPFTIEFNFRPVTVVVQCGNTQTQIAAVRQMQAATIPRVGHLRERQNNGTITLIESQQLWADEGDLAALNVVIATINHGEYFCQHPEERPTETKSSDRESKI